MVSKIIFNSNYQIIEKEPVRVLTPIQCNGTKKTLGTTKRKRVSSKYQIFVTKIIIFIQNGKIKEPLRVLSHINMMEP